MDTSRGAGRIELITGPMFAGKSEELIRRLRRLMIAKAKIQIFTPSIDKRYGDSVVASHNHQKIEALSIDSAADIFAALKKDTEVVAVDEVQFLDSALIDLFDTLANNGKIVIATGLDLDFKAEPFYFRDGKATMAELMVKSDFVTKLTAICVFREDGKICGELATRSQRLIDGKPAPYNSPLIQVGAEESYEPRCRKHHSIPDKAEKFQLDLF